MDSGETGSIIAEKIICEVPHKHIQWRLTVNEFRGVEYLHLRKYYLSFDEDYLPSNEGACFPATIEAVSALFCGLCEILAEGESLHHLVRLNIPEEHIKELLHHVKGPDKPTDI